MRSGELTRTIKVKALATSHSTLTGESLETYSTWCVDLWAKVEQPRMPLESFGGQDLPQRLYQDIRVFTVRYSSLSTAIKATCVIEYGSKTYNILSIENVGERDRSFRILAEAIS